jgi:glucokinase
VVSATHAQLQATQAAAREEAPDHPAPEAVTISAPGPLDPFAGVLIDPPNLHHSLWNFPLAARLGDAANLPALLERDTQIAVLAEGDFGAARGLNDYVYLTVSTGIGGGVVSGGRLLRGADGLANELGHLTIDFNGPPCGCGARGHLEGMASGSGIARMAKDAGLANVDGSEMSGRDVAAAADAGHKHAQRIIDTCVRAFAAAAVTIVDVYNPERIIVGGGLAMGQGDRLLQPAREAVQELAFKRQAARVGIVPAQLGDDVGLIGGLSLVTLARLSEN